MTEWLLIIILTNNGKSVTTVKLPDKASCYRAAAVATRTTTYGVRTGCVEVTKGY